MSGHAFAHRSGSFAPRPAYRRRMQRASLTRPIIAAKEATSRCNPPNLLHRMRSLDLVVISGYYVRAQPERRAACQQRREGGGSSEHAGRGSSEEPDLEVSHGARGGQENVPTSLTLSRLPVIRPSPPGQRPARFHWHEPHPIPEQSRSGIPRVADRRLPVRWGAAFTIGSSGLYEHYSTVTMGCQYVHPAISPFRRSAC